MATVFVYGTLKRGEDNHYLLRNCQYLGPHMMRAKVDMYHVGFPVLMRAPKTQMILGELYRVDKATLKALDHLESNGRMYKRARKRLNRQDHRRYWVYIGMDRFWNGRLPEPVETTPDVPIVWGRQPTGFADRLEG